MAKWFLLLAACVATAMAAPAADPDQDQKVTNQFVDQILDAVRQQPKFDPMEVREFHEMIHKQIGLIPVEGELILKDMVMTGLKHIERNGDAELDNQNGGFKATMFLKDHNLEFSSLATVNVGLPVPVPELKITANIGTIDIKFGLEIGSDAKAKLTEFFIDEFQNVDVHVHGLSLLDPLVDVVSDGVIKLFNSIVREQITEIVRPVIEANLKNFNPLGH